MSITANKPAAGFFLGCVSALLALLGLVFCLVNAGTSYFKSTGIGTDVIVFAVLAILCEAAGLVLSLKKQILAGDLLQIAAPVFLILALILFLSSRINGIAAIMTFTNTAQNMSDLASAIIGIALLLAAWLTSLVAGFLRTVK